jgi:hypothetical protein
MKKNLFPSRFILACLSLLVYQSCQSDELAGKRYGGALLNGKQIRVPSAPREAPGGVQPYCYMPPYSALGYIGT